MYDFEEWKRKKIIKGEWIDYDKSESGERRRKKDRDYVAATYGL